MYTTKQETLDIINELRNGNRYACFTVANALETALADGIPINFFLTNSMSKKKEYVLDKLTVRHKYSSLERLHSELYEEDIDKVVDNEMYKSLLDGLVKGHFIFEENENDTKTMTVYAMRRELPLN